MRGNQVRIKFNEDLMEQKPQEIQDTVVHELLHVLFYKLMNKIVTMINNHVKQIASQKQHEAKLGRLEHEVIERLVSAFLLEKTYT